MAMAVWTPLVNKAKPPAAVTLYCPEIALADHNLVTFVATRGDTALLTLVVAGFER
jgi:hypothetical protein